MLAFSIFVLAAVLWWYGWRFARIFTAIGMVLERVANRAAVNNGQPPITTKEDEALFR